MGKRGHRSAFCSSAASRGGFRARRPVGAVAKVARGQPVAACFAAASARFSARVVPATALLP
eukprot:4333553-Lingulodinium_polyedra.AAC.1